MEDAELESSELGTRTYWQETYKNEIKNFNNHGNMGDVWFGEDSADRVIMWIANCGIPKDSAVVDIGCGNGYTLTGLASEGFTNLLGLDYCEDAISLAEKVSKEKYPFIRFQMFDIINDKTESLGCKFRVVHDKGTYDAVSLNPDNPRLQRLKYISRVADMLEDNGLFIITSCNWTDEELMKHFMDVFKLKCIVPTPQFKFGGRVGGVVSSVVFVKQ